MAVYTCDIDGSDVDVLIESLDVSWVANGLDTLSLAVESEDASVRPQPREEIVLYRDATAIFGGIITEAPEEGFGDFTGDHIVTRVTAVGFGIYASYRYATVTLAAGTLKSMLTTLVTNYLTGFGVSLHGSQVNGPTLPELVFTRTRVDEVLSELCTRAGHTWSISPTKVLRTVEVGTVAAPFDLLNSGAVYQTGDVKITQTLDDGYANRVTVLVTGAGPATSSESFVAADGVVGGGFTTFTAKYPSTQSVDDIWPNVLYFDGVSQGPIAFGVNNLVQNGGLFGWAWDPTTQPATLVYDSTSPGVVFPTSEVIDITYSIGYPYAVTVDDTVDQASYGIRELIIEAPQAMSDEAATQLGQTILDNNAPTITRAEYSTLSEGLMPGQVQTINLPTRHINESFLITEVRARVEPGGDGSELFHSVTAVGGSVVKGQWQQVYKDWLGGLGGTHFGGGVAATGVSGTVISTADVVANRPSFGSAGGPLFFQRDGLFLHRDAGPVVGSPPSSGGWETFAPLKKMTPPDDSDFSWLNQGGATINSTYGYPYMETAVTGSTGTFDAHARMKANPGGAFTLTAVFAPTMLALANTFLGFCMRETSSGRLQTFGWEANAGVLRIFGLRWLSPTSRGAGPAWAGGSPNFYNFNGGAVFMRVVYNGSNSLLGQISLDGNHWITTATHDPTASSFMSTIDEYGWFISAEQSAGNPNVGCALLHWDEA